MAKLGVRLNLTNGGLTQVDGWNFNSVAELGDRLVALDAGGIAELGGDLDDASEIESTVKSPTSNFNIP